MKPITLMIVFVFYLLLLIMFFVFPHQFVFEDGITYHKTFTYLPWRGWSTNIKGGWCMNIKAKENNKGEMILPDQAFGVYYDKEGHKRYRGFRGCNIHLGNCPLEGCNKTKSDQ